MVQCCNNFSCYINIFWIYPRSEYGEGNNEITSGVITSSELVSTLPDKSWSKSEIIDYARKVARSKMINEELFITIMLRESGANPLAVGDFDKPRKNCRSRGLFQINSCYWSEITDECAFSPRCNINWAADRFREGRIELFTSWILN